MQFFKLLWLDYVPGLMSLKSNHVIIKKEILLDFYFDSNILLRCYVCIFWPELFILKQCILLPLIWETAKYSYPYMVKSLRKMALCDRLRHVVVILLLFTWNVANPFAMLGHFIYLTAKCVINYKLIKMHH